MRDFPTFTWAGRRHWQDVLWRRPVLMAEEVFMSRILESVLAGIKGADTGAEERARRQWDSLAKPLGSLGMMEDMIVRMAGSSGTEQISTDHRCLVVFCADNGVVKRGVSQSDHQVTAAVARALGEGTSTANVLARQAGCRVLAVDIGMKEHPPFEGVEDRCVRRGTGDITCETAMTREETIEAVEIGIRLAGELKQKGCRLLLTGEMGIGNTTTAAAVSCVLLGREPALLAGRGAGLDTEGLKRKILAIEKALAFHHPDSSDPVGILSRVGGTDIAGLTGLCLGGAFYRIPVLLDGVITLAAAALACSLCPAARDHLFPSHLSAEPASAMLLEKMGLEAPIHAKIRLGEGAGALMALPVLDAAIALYSSGHTFGKLGIEAYRKLD